jgi:hypothetical protein
MGGRVKPAGASTVTAMTTGAMGGTDEERAAELAQHVTTMAGADDSDMPELVREVLRRVPIDRRPILVHARALLVASSDPSASRARRVVDHALAIFGSYPER